MLGKNQSIYREINFDFLRNEKLKLTRIISGGGTVYHDTGNLNFALISKFAEEKINNYKLLNRELILALQNTGINASFDARNNIICQGKKISGNAQFTNRKNIISHGTLLVDADLNILRSCLAENSFKVETKAVRSVGSPVINIKEITKQFATAQDLSNYLTETLTTQPTYRFTDIEWNNIEKLANEKFQSFEWVYGRSPHTKITRGEIEIEIDNGVIIKISGPDSIPDLQGMKYEYASIKKALEIYPNASELLSTIF